MNRRLDSSDVLYVTIRGESTINVTEQSSEWERIKDEIVRTVEEPNMNEARLLEESQAEDAAIERTKEALGVNDQQIAQIFKAQKLADQQLRKERADLRQQKRAEPKFTIIRSYPLTTEYSNEHIRQLSNWVEPFIYEVSYKEPYGYQRSFGTALKLKRPVEIDLLNNKRWAIGMYNMTVDRGSVNTNLPKNNRHMEFVKESRAKSASQYLIFDQIDCAAYVLAFIYDEYDVIKKLLVVDMKEAHKIDMGDIDFAGYDDIVQQCMKIIETTDERITNRHILLAGPPGCGKSTAVKQLIKQTPGWLHHSIMTGDIRWVDMLPQLNELAQYIGMKLMILIDEIDEVGLNREVSRDRVYQLMRAMDGIQNTKMIKFVATTNRPGDLDAALLRVGRFGPMIVMEEPSTGQRVEIVEYYAKKYKANIDLVQVAQCCDHVTGCDIRAAFDSCIIYKQEINTTNVILNLREILHGKQFISSIYQ